MNRELFRGSSAAEAEDFIQAVRSKAWSEQKQSDYKWMAEYAAAQMIGSALRWHMSLPRDVQADWRKLETALLDRFAPEPPPAAARDDPTVPRGAFAGPKLATGRIRVVAKTGRLVGWIAKLGNKEDCMNRLTLDTKEAVIVQYEPSNALITFELQDQADFQRLALRRYLGLDIQPDDMRRLGLICIATGRKPGTIRYSDNACAGEQRFVQTDVWRVGQDGLIVPVWPPSPEVDLGITIKKNDPIQFDFWSNPDKVVEHRLSNNQSERASLEFEYI